MINNESKRIWKEAIVTYSSFYPSICLEGLSKTLENFSQAAELRSEYLQNKNLERDW